jgi:isopenicillin N synthase-like dioxygenase
VKEAAATWGFFQVINHGIPVQTLEETINAIKAFHEQPHEVKSKYYKRDEGKA